MTAGVVAPRPRDARRRCHWCGVRRDDHADFGGDAVMLGPGICPAWMPPAPWLLRALAALAGPTPNHARPRGPRRPGGDRDLS